MKPCLIVLPGLALLAACAAPDARGRVVLDGAPSAAFQSDLSACRALARAQEGPGHPAAGAAALGAGAGALLAAAEDEEEAGAGALVGALAGGAAGAVKARERREAILGACLRGRGHPVVG
jgi:hypothetical protein